MIGYFTRSAADFISRYRSGKGVYKPLRAGEWDMMTPGLAYIYGSTESKLYLRGGIVHGELDSKRMYSRWRAPLHRRDLHQQKDSKILDEERFGVVMRHRNSKEKYRWIHAPDSATAFAKEYLRILGRDDKRLAVLMEGDLFNDTGELLTHDDTGEKLRALQEYYDASGAVIYQKQIDDAGSIKIKGEASRLELNEKAANTTLKIQRLLAEVSTSIGIVAGTSVAVTGGTAQIGGSTSTLLGPDSASTDFAVRGTLLVTDVLTPLIQALALHFQLLSLPPPPIGAGPIDFNTYKPLGAALAAQLQAILPSLSQILSSNVKISK
jgi:hypothetical protein